MKQTIEIEVPDGKKAVWKDNKVVFEDIKPKLPKTWEEFCELYPKQEGEAYIEEDGYIQAINIGSSRCEILDKNMLPSKKAAEQHLALMQLHQLRDCYRQGWFPKQGELYFTNFNIVRFNHNYYDIHKYNYAANTFLSFQTLEIAKEFLNNFRDLIEQAGDLI